MWCTELLQLSPLAKKLLSYFFFFFPLHKPVSFSPHLILHHCIWSLIIWPPEKISPCFLGLFKHQLSTKVQFEFHFFWEALLALSMGLHLHPLIHYRTYSPYNEFNIFWNFLLWDATYEAEDSARWDTPGAGRAGGRRMGLGVQGVTDQRTGDGVWRLESSG